jgi:branched-chain amino acid transport system ATP-binding protein
MTALLSVNQLRVAYGEIEALHGIDLEVNEGEIVTLIGANGAGKTTTLRTISGLLKPKHGTVHFHGNDITGVKPHIITAKGISHVPEGRGIFANLTSPTTWSSAPTSAKTKSRRRSTTGSSRSSRSSRSA